MVNSSQPPKSSNNQETVLSILLKRIFAFETGLILIILLCLIFATLVTFWLPNAQNIDSKDARKELLAVFTSVITASFALLQTTKQSSSKESQEKITELQQAIQAIANNQQPNNLLENVVTANNVSDKKSNNTNNQDKNLTPELEK
ncbi:MAG TPA: hypothetical protein VK184_27500 [Nostocaceae cyanobacterium]|nr:hypothetical protein [Nostocaceae cyanobacterium]